MANEARISLQLSFTPANIATINFGPFNSIGRDVAGTVFTYRTQTTSTSKAALALGNISTPGLCMMKNVDATDIIYVYPDNAGSPALIELLPGDIQQVRFKAAIPYINSSANTPILQYLVLPV